MKKKYCKNQVQKEINVYDFIVANEYVTMSSKHTLCHHQYSTDKINTSSKSLKLIAPITAAKQP